MNCSLPGFSLSKAIEGFLQHKAAQALSSRTLQSYEQHLRDLSEHVGDVCHASGYTEPGDLSQVSQSTSAN